MAARKLQQEVDKCFKKVGEGVTEFEAIYEKIEQSNNPAQKEKLEDNLKREIKKLQRLRDQIKTWAASNDIKDKAPLLEHRKLIETQMEKFKAVEKAMKTKAYSKEGLSAAAKLDPKEQAKVEAGEFLSSMVDELEQQIEILEAEGESIQATMKKGKNNTAKAERMAELERIIERHKWHQGKLELIRRSLENGGVDTDQVNDLEESIRYYVSDGMNDDFMEDEEMYDELDLVEEEAYGIPLDNEKNSSQDTQSVQDDGAPEFEPPKPVVRKPQKDSDSASGRRTSSQVKSPLPALATLHTPLAAINNGNQTGPTMKPASVPTRPAGEGLKYASAAAAAAASDKNNLGIAPLPPPPGAPITSASPSQSRASAANSPAVTPAQPVPQQQPDSKQSTGPPANAPTGPANRSPEAINSSMGMKMLSRRSVKASGKQPLVPIVPEKPRAEPSRPEASRLAKSRSSTSHRGAVQAATPNVAPRSNGVANSGTNNSAAATKQEPEEEECIYHLPASLRDLVDCYDEVKQQAVPPTAPSTLRMMNISQANCPDAIDAEVPRSYRPDMPMPPSGSGFPREPLPIFDDPRLYGRIDPDTLFYVFYYKQGTQQQYLAAKALKDQSWRFHKQYQTWFQRHEEPKNITEDFEQGTYRFFDYESTWMNRRKADFKFAYKFLEDDV